MNTIINQRIYRQILYISFNQDFSCISIGTDEGYLIYNVEPIKLIFEKSK